MSESNIENRGEIIIYRAEDNTVQLDVRMENETVWLSTSQMAALFNKEESNIRRHILNVFRDEEVSRDNNVHFLHVNGVKKPVPYYSLDVVLSIGYRVNSKRAIAFRQWSTKILKEFIIKGYAINEKLRREQLSDLRQLVQIVGRTVQSKAVESADETQAIFDVVLDYTYALDTLDNYDYERLTVKETTPEERFHATYENAMQTIGALREKFGGKDLYPSVEEKAAMLLYLVTKNHSFSDGTKRLADNTLVALTLMIAESRTEEKDTMVKVVVNLINQKN